MRVWDVHPGYLSHQSLLGQHAEIHAIHSIIRNGKAGYAAHPETVRWQGRLGELAAAHDLSVREMRLRGFNHHSPLPDFAETTLNEKRAYVDAPVGQFAILREKYGRNGQTGRIPLPLNGSQFWAHHKYSVMARGYQHYKDTKGILRVARDLPLAKEEELVNHILSLMELPLLPGAIRNVADHLWGYFKKSATLAEKEEFFSLNPENPGRQFSCLYQLARKYGEMYLLQSTVFADI
jgi:hypothetical protein